jgi:hypothetical protein
MCDVPGTADYPIESIECFFLVLFADTFSPLVTIPMAGMITDIMKHITFRIR